MTQTNLYIRNTMNNHHYSFEKLADYVDGKVSVDQKEAIEQHVEACEICQNILEGIHHHYTHVSPSRTDIENYLDGFLVKQQALIEAKQQEVGGTRERANVRSLNAGRTNVWLKVAAILLLGVGVLGIYRIMAPTSSPYQLAEQHLEESYPMPTIRGGQVLEGENERWQAVVDAYQKKDYTMATTLIEKAILVDGEAGKRYFYLGLSYLQQDPPQAQKAIAPLQKVLASKNRYQEQAAWYLALAYLGSDQLEKGKTQLQQIVDKETWKAKEAAALLGDL